MKSTHTLAMKCGVTVTMTVDEATCAMDVEWSQDPPFATKLFDQILEEYIPWRDNIIEDWCVRSGKTIAVLTKDGKGGRFTKFPRATGNSVKQ